MDRVLAAIKYIINLCKKTFKKQPDDRIENEDLFIPIKTLIRHFKFECKDDWYPDTLLYKDYFKSQNLKKLLLNHINNPSSFDTQYRDLYNLPKKGFTMRYALETPFHDRFIYHALVSQLIPVYDKIISPRILSHRYSSVDGKPQKYLYKHPIEQWRSFEEYVRDSLEPTPPETNYKVLLETDLVNYFENIRIDDLIKILRDKSSSINILQNESIVIHSAIDSLEKLLPQWSFHQENGLPQNRDASSFLANILMNEIDKEMISIKKYDYYRYMDDIKIACEDEFTARQALKDLIILLRPFGLNVNSSKTKILSKGDTEYDEFMTGGSRELERLDSMWKSKSLPVIKRSFPHLKSFTLDLIKNQRTQDRSFRFCIKRLEILALCKDIEVPHGYLDGITDIIIDEIITQPYTSDQFIRYLKAVELTDPHFIKLKTILLNKKNWVYGWQIFLLWQLFVYKSYSDNDIKNLALETIENKQSHPSILSGAALYIGAIGNENDKIILSKNFKHIENYLTQRNALIALQDLNYHDHIADNVAPYVNKALMGTYRNIKKDFPNIYFMELEPISYKSIYNEFSHYE